MKKLIRKIKKYITLKRGKFYIDEKGVITLPKGCSINIFDKSSHDDFGNSIKINEKLKELGEGQ